MTIFHFTYFFHSALNFFKKEPDDLRYFFKDILNTVLKIT